MVRPEGFEPPAYCSVAEAIGWRKRCIACNALVPTSQRFCSSCGYDWRPSDELLLNPPCPMCGAPRVWGVCTGTHADDLALAA